MAGMITRGGDIEISIVGNLEGFNRTLDDAEKLANQRFGNIARTSGAIMTGMGVAVTGALGMAVKSATDFGSELAKLRTLGVEDIDKLGDGVMDLSTKFGFDMTQAVGKAYDVISNGMPSDAFVLALEPAARAAIAGQGDLSDAFDAGMGVMSAYGLNTQNVSQEVANFERVLNALTVGTIYGKVTFRDMGDELGRVTPLTHECGVSVEQLGAAIGASTSYGLKSSEALTGMKAALNSVLNPSQNAVGIMKSLGVEWTVTSLKAKGMVEFFKEARDAAEKHNAALLKEREAVKAAIDSGTRHGQELKNLKARYKELGDTQGDWQQSLAKAVGSTEGLNWILGITSEQGIKTYKEAVDKATVSQKTFFEMSEEEMKKDPSLAWKKMENEVQKMAVTFGKSLLPAINQIMPGLQAHLAWLTEEARVHPEATQYILEGAAALGVTSMALGPLLYSLPALVSAYAGLKSAKAQLTGAAAREAQEMREAARAQQETADRVKAASKETRAAEREMAALERTAGRMGKAQEKVGESAASLAPKMQAAQERVRGASDALGRAEDKAAGAAARLRELEMAGGGVDGQMKRAAATLGQLGTRAGVTEGELQKARKEVWNAAAELGKAHEAAAKAGNGLAAVESRSQGVAQRQAEMRAAVSQTNTELEAARKRVWDAHTELSTLQERAGTAGPAMEKAGVAAKAGAVGFTAMGTAANLLGGALQAIGYAKLVNDLYAIAQAAWEAHRAWVELQWVMKDQNKALMSTVAVLEKEGIAFDKATVSKLNDGAAIDYLTGLRWQHIQATHAGVASNAALADANKGLSEEERAAAKVIAETGAETQEVWNERLQKRYNLSAGEKSIMDKMSDAQREAFRAYVRELTTTDETSEERTKKIREYLERLSLDHHESPSVNELAQSSFGTYATMLQGVVDNTGVATGSMRGSWEMACDAVGGSFDRLGGRVEAVLDQMARETQAAVEYVEQSTQYMDGLLGFANGGVIPGFARGGVTHHRIVMVGEKGPEPVALPVGSRVMSHAEMTRAVSGGGGGGGVGGDGGSVSVNVDMRGMVVRNDVDVDKMIGALTGRVRDALVKRGRNASLTA